MRLKALTILVLLFITNKNFAQNRKDFRLNVGFQYNLAERALNKKIPSYNNKNEGIGFHVQPRWMANNNLALGLNLEYAVVTEDYIIDAIDVFEIVSVAPTAYYYFGNNKLKPFVGLAAGVYHSIGHKPFMPIGARAIVGVAAFGIFDLSLEYNNIFTKIQYNPRAIGGFDNYYLGIKGSFSIGILNLRKG